MKKRWILVLAMIVALVGGLVGASCAAPAPAPGAPAPVEVTNWRMQAFTPPDSESYVRDLELIGTIEELTGGRLVIEMFPGGAITPAGEEIHGVQDGTVEAGSTGSGNIVDTCPPAPMFASALGGLKGMQMNLWMHHGGGKELMDRMLAGPFPNVKFVVMTRYGLPEIWGHFNVPINSVADLQGVKMRAYGDCVEVLARLGMASVYLPGGEIYEAMQRGVIDAVEWGAAGSNYRMAFHEISTYVYLSASRAPTDGTGWYATKAAWAGLDPLDQAIVLEAAKAHIVDAFAEEMIADAGYIQAFRDYGCEVLPIPPEVDDELIRVAREFYEERAAGDSFYAEVVKSHWDFMALCESVGLR